MIDFETLLGIKSASVIAGIIGSAVSIIVDFRSHSIYSGVASLIAGAFVAGIATEPTIEMFELSTSWGYAIAGTYGVAGRNLVIWISRISKNPPATISAFFKSKEK